MPPEMHTDEKPPATIPAISGIANSLTENELKAAALRLKKMFA